MQEKLENKNDFLQMFCTQMWGKMALKWFLVEFYENAFSAELFQIFLAISVFFIHEKIVKT